MEDVDLAYTAGLIDGEGSILIARGNGTYWLQVRVTNTDKEMIDRLKQDFGGHIVAKNEKASHRNLPCWYWEISSKGGAEFLKKIFRFLRTKKEQARLAIEFQEKKQVKEGFRLSNEELALREDYKRRIHELNIRKREPEEVLQTIFE